MLYHAIVESYTSSNARVMLLCLNAGILKLVKPAVAAVAYAPSLPLPLSGSRLLWPSSWPGVGICVAGSKRQASKQASKHTIRIVRGNSSVAEKVVSTISLLLLVAPNNKQAAEEEEGAIPRKRKFSAHQQPLEDFFRGTKYIRTWTRHLPRTSKSQTQKDRLKYVFPLGIQFLLRFGRLYFLYRDLFCIVSSKGVTKQTV